MASSNNLSNKLTEHLLFKDLKKDCKPNQENVDCKNIAAINDGYLYVWDDVNKHILVSNLKAFSNIPDSEFSNIHSEDELHRNGKSYQRMQCLRPPIHDVHRLLFSSEAGDLALIGRLGVTVVSMPTQKSRFARLGNGGDKIICKCKTIGEKLFSNQTSLKILDVSWHPGTDRHVVLLCSDNMLRIYDLNSSFKPRLTYDLIPPSVEDPSTPNTPTSTTTPSRTKLNVPQKGSKSTPKFDHSSSLDNATFRLNTKIALGETAISFDFLPPVSLKCKRLPMCPRNNENQIAWPICILNGDGDIFYFLSTLPNQGAFATLYAGPLHLYPGISFGSDACSIRCLIFTVPSVLVVATTSGLIYHCVIMSEQNADAQNQFEVVRSSPGYRSNYYSPSTLNLFVHETVELEMTMKKQVDNELYSYPIELRKDAVHINRYYCLHKSGIHCVTLPWCNTLKELCEGEADTFIEKEARIDHMLCLQPITHVPCTQTLWAFCLSDDQILCITSEMNVIALNHPRYTKLDVLTLHSAKPGQSDNTANAFPYDDSFERQISDILRCKHDNPVLSAGNSANDLDERMCYELLTQMTKVFRDQNIKRFQEAKKEILLRLDVLNNLKNIQISEIDKISSDRLQMLDKTERMKATYQQAIERQDAINQRLELISMKVKHRLPQLSDAERSIKNQFICLEDNIESMKSSIQQLKKKKDFQTEHYNNDKLSAIEINLQQNRYNNAKTILKKEGDEIEELVNTVNNLRTILGKI